MQKFIFIEAHSGGDHGLSEINFLLENGWEVVKINSSVPSNGDNIHMAILIEKKEADSDEVYNVGDIMSY